jgi:ubiquinone/menaquinone biosynthesis C-methylase UbiE
MSVGPADVIAFEPAPIGSRLSVLVLSDGQGGRALALVTSIEPHGHVTLTAPEPGQLEALADLARHHGLAHLTLRLVQAYELPFPDGTFDRVVTEIGGLATARLNQVVRETQRVLKPRGLATFVTSPPAADSFAPPAGPNAVAAAMQGAGFTEVDAQSRVVVTGVRGAKIHS